MRHFMFALALPLAVLAGCGVDTLGSAATVATMKKQELEQGKKTMEQAQKKIAEAMQQGEQRNQKAADAALN